MSILIKGIDLPKCSNEDCIVVIRKDKAEVWQTGFKERTVKAIQIPKGHGGIADMKTFKVDVVDVTTGKVSWTVNQILEAEEE